MAILFTLIGGWVLFIVAGFIYQKRNLHRFPALLYFPETENIDHLIKFQLSLKLDREYAYKLSENHRSMI
jgi:hypothetical protein